MKLFVLRVEVQKVVFCGGVSLLNGIAQSYFRRKWSEWDSHAGGPIYPKAI